MKEQLEKLDARLAKMNEANTELAGKIGARDESRKAMVDRQAVVATVASDALARLTGEQKAEQQSMAAAHKVAKQALAGKVTRQHEHHEAELKAFDTLTTALRERRAANKVDYGDLCEARALLVKAAEAMQPAKGDAPK